MVVSRIVQVLALLTVSVGVISGASWWFDRWQALAFGTTEVPMAPSTAFSFVLLGASMFAGSRWPRARGARIFGIGTVSLVLVLSLLLGTQAVIGNDPVLERWIVGDLLTASGIPAGRMSPLTALAFVLASIALLSRGSALPHRPIRLSISVILSWGIFLISEVTLVGYAAGLPPLLGNSAIPVAAATAFAFMLVSAALLLPSLMQVSLLALPADTKAARTIWRGVAIVAIGFVAAVALRSAIVGGVANDILPYVTFYPAVLIIALITGLAGGLLATLIAGIYVQVWLHGGMLTGTEWLALAVFLIGSTITSLICEATRQGRGRERRAGAQVKLALAEQKQAVEALQQSENKFRAVFEQAAVGVARLAIDGTWLEVNEQLCKIVGYSREELLSKTFQDITHPDDLQVDLDYIERLLRGEIDTYSMEKRYYRKSGEIVWINLTVSLARNSQGEPSFFIAIIEDITERRELRERIEKIATHVPGALYQYQQWPDGRTAFPYASSGIRDIYGVEPAAVASDATAVFEVIHPDDLARVGAKVAESMRGLTVWHDSFRVQFPDGRVIWTEGEASPEAQADGSVLWHGYIRDVTTRKHHEERRRQLQEMLSRTEREARIGSWEWDIAKDRVTWSDELFRLFQIDPTEGAPSFAEHHRLYGPEDLARLKDAVDAAIDHGTPFTLDLVARRRDGSTRDCLAHGYPETGPDLQVTHLFGSMQDITERKQAEQKLRLAASVFEHSFEGILVTDAGNRIVDTNPAFRTITGYDPASVLGKDPSILASGRHDQAFYRAMWHAITQKGFWRGEIWNRRKDGEVYAELLSISTIRHADGSVQNYIAVFSDISELKAHEAELDRIANYDHLTGLPNRRLLSDRLEQAIARQRRSQKHVAVCYLDLDGFKPINDRYGHEVGDELLIGIANQLSKVLRAQDTVARIGGDEFVLLLNDLTRLEDSQELLDRVLAASTSAIVVDGVTHRVSASVGVALSPPDVDSADSLLRHADQAMYRAKDAGRNRYHFYDAEQDQLLQSRRLQTQRIKEGLANQEFMLHYQPKVDMVSREVIGLEALIRWQHPEKGLLFPAAFLPVVEGGDLEPAVGEWVIEAVLTQVAAWKRLGLTLPVSVNIGAEHLLKPSFAERLGQLFAEHPECDPGCLELEILETSALSDIQQAGETLTACHALGVRCALDDFGTGYSSLAYFRRLPIDVLKIDQSFVRDMLDDPNDMEIVESVVRLAHAFNRMVIAEGVETPEHGALLTLLGCQFGQGYGIARPMPADAVPGWVSTWPEQGEAMVAEGISKDDIPLTMAGENHRHWISEFADALDHGNIPRLIDIESTPCRFQRWYQGSGSHRFEEFQGFRAAGQSHVRAHELASSIVALAQQGDMDSARQQLSDLFKVRDELIGHLRELVGKQKAADE